MIHAPLKLKMATSVLQDDEAAAMGNDGGDVGGHPSSPTAVNLSALNPKGQADKGSCITASAAAVSAATGEGDDATFGAAPPSSGAEMLPKLELEVIVEESREVSVGDLEDEESSHLVDKTQTPLPGKLAEGQLQESKSDPYSRFIAAENDTPQMQG